MYSTRQRVFVSFDYENDRHYKFLLEAWHENQKFDFVFKDGSSQEINSNDVGRVKASLTAKINQAAYTLVLVGKYANNSHRDRLSIGSKNWINFEIRQSKINHNRIVAVRLERFVDAPEELLDTRVTWVDSFSESAIIDALNRAIPS